MAIIKDIYIEQADNFTFFYNIKNTNLLFTDQELNENYDEIYKQLNEIGFNNELNATITKYEVLNIGINISNTCNFKCRYCFAKHPFEKITINEACEFIKKQVYKNIDCSKFIVDLSGAGEPLLVIEEIFKIKEFCVNLSNEIEKEILVMFVSNGYLLTKELAKKIQEKNILFGISIDGSKNIHDSNRILQNGNPTFDVVYQNTMNIEDKTYVGIAISLEFGDYDLYEFFNLYKDFNTISIKPLRPIYSGKQYMKKCKEMLKSYMELTDKLLMDIENHNLKNLYKLLNGEDYFGRFISRLIHHDIVVERCDICKNRISIKGKKEYICTSATFNDEFLLENYKKKTASRCDTCIIKNLCGGECQLMIENNEPNYNMCKLKEIFFYNSVRIYHKLLTSNQFIEVYNFIEDKNSTIKLSANHYHAVVGTQVKAPHSFYGFM